jgi:putative nucleotidyltransferase with HDIG domain
MNKACPGGDTPVEKSPAFKELMEVIAGIARGRYSERIMALTKDGQPQAIRLIAEAMAMMMVKVEAREFRLEQLNHDLRLNILKTVTAIAHALGARDPYCEGHAQRVGDLAERLARRIGLSDEEVEHVRTAGVLHDIGKIGFSDGLLTNEDTHLNDEFKKEIREHPVRAAAILEGLDFLGPVVAYVLSHHERMDGQGYPHGLLGDEIPLGARIIAVADCFDAINTDRPYRKGKSQKDALAVLDGLSGSALDPKLVAAFTQMLAAGEKDRRENGAPPGDLGFEIER